MCLRSGPALCPILMLSCVSESGMGHICLPAQSLGSDRGKPWLTTQDLGCLILDPYARSAEHWDQVGNNSRSKVWPQQSHALDLRSFLPYPINPIAHQAILMVARCPREPWSKKYPAKSCSVKACSQVSAYLHVSWAVLKGLLPLSYAS